MQTCEFNSYLMIKAAEEVNGDWIVSGPIASQEEDYDGDIITKSAVLSGLSMFFKLGGHVDYEHQYEKSKDTGKPDPDYLIGKAIDVFNNAEDRNRPWVRIQLYKSSELAKKVWHKIQDGCPMGVSLFGRSLHEKGTEVVIEGKLINRNYN
ncbi:MAG: XkdF-like putative serine protease domain-containing protein, partial [Chthonomonadales bacterium]